MVSTIPSAGFGNLAAGDSSVNGTPTRRGDFRSWPEVHSRCSSAGRRAGSDLALEGAVHGRPGHGEHLGQAGDRVVAGGVYAPQFCGHGHFAAQLAGLFGPRHSELPGEHDGWPFVRGAGTAVGSKRTDVVRIGDFPHPVAAKFFR